MQGLTDKIKRIAKQIFSPTQSRGAGFVRSNASGVKVSQDDALGVDTVLACVRVLSESIASLPRDLYLRGADDIPTKAKDHTLHEILRWQANAECSSFDFWQWIMIDTLIAGNGLAQVYREDGIIKGLYPLEASKARLLRDKNGHPVWIYSHRGDQISIDYNDTLHLKCFSCKSLISPSIIDLASESLGSAKAANDYSGKYFANGANVNSYLQAKTELEDEQFKNLDEYWANRAVGNDNAHKTPILEGGIEVKSLSLNHADAQLIETRKYNRGVIAGLFRVPAHLINDLEKATYSNIEHTDLGFVKHSLTPWLEKIEQQIRMQLLTPEERDAGYYAKHNINSLLRGDLPSRYAAYAQAIQNGWLSTNDVRKSEDLPPIEGGDVYFHNGTMKKVEEKSNES